VISVRRTLLVTLLAAVATVTAAAAFLVYRLARQEIDSIFDYHLRQIALSLREQVPSGAGAVGIPGAGADFIVQVWDRDGTRLYRSRAGTGLPESAQLGLATVRGDAGEWRVYSAEIAGLVIQVAQPMRVRQQLAFAAAVRTLAPVLLIIPLLAVLVWRIVGRALAPFDRLARAVESRTPAALDRIGEAGVPEEALPLVRSLNELLVRLGTALAAQRAFVADAAHELRTPLAALSLQAQLVERAKDEVERGTALSQLRAGLERATRLVQQLLTLARAEPDAATVLPSEPVRLDALVRQAVADHALVAESRGVDLGATRVDEAALVQGDPAALRTLLANLVDNAVRYAPAGGRVDVAAGLAQGRPYLEVADDGPGIPVVERSRVFDRFYRREGSADSGSGLGLAIVRAVAERHQADVILGDTPGGGLTARVEFGPRTPGKASASAEPNKDGPP
jgi:two-component system, OmpR family, sensor kinase